MRKSLRWADRIWEKILRFLDLDLCAICAHARAHHGFEPGVDTPYCSTCRIGDVFHTFEEQERRAL